jgi:hypothetical protein
VNEHAMLMHSDRELSPLNVVPSSMLLPEVEIWLMYN